jgi:hypothetical protein
MGFICSKLYKIQTELYKSQVPYIYFTLSHSKGINAAKKHGIDSRLDKRFIHNLCILVTKKDKTLDKLL